MVTAMIMIVAARKFLVIIKQCPTPPGGGERELVGVGSGAGQQADAEHHQHVHRQPLRRRYSHVHWYVAMHCNGFTY